MADTKFMSKTDMAYKVLRAIVIVLMVAAMVIATTVAISLFLILKKDHKQINLTKIRKALQ